MRGLASGGTFNVDIVIALELVALWRRPPLRPFMAKVLCATTADQEENMINGLQNCIAAASIRIVSGSALIASIGLLRLPNLYTRMHAASEAGTLGSCSVLLALAVNANDPAIALRAVAGVMFFLLTVPISSHLLAPTAHGIGYKLWEGSERDNLKTVLDHGSDLTLPSTVLHQSKRD